MEITPQKLSELHVRTHELIIRGGTLKCRLEQARKDDTSAGAVFQAAQDFRAMEGRITERVQMEMELFCAIEHGDEDRIRKAVHNLETT